MNKTVLFTLSILLSVLVAGQTFTSSPNSHINDNGATDFTQAVSGLVPSNIDTTTFGLETVCVNLTHTWDSDLDIYIVAPDGTSAMLVCGQGGSDDNYTNTCFNSDAAQSISGQSAPFTGTFAPMGQMGLVNNGQNANGTWTLHVVDTYGGDDGTLLSWSITFGNNPAGYFTVTESDLPIVVIQTNGQEIPDDPKILADMGIIWNGDGNRNHVTDPFNHYNNKVGIERRGASSSMFPKKSYTIELRDEFGNGIDSSLLGFPAEEDFVLSGQYTDKTLMRGSLSFHLINKMGWYAPRTRPVELFINDEYRGIYILMEKPKRDSNRINISKLNTDELTGDDLTGGYIFKVDKVSSGDITWQSPYLPWPGGNPVNFIYDYPDPDLMPTEQATYLQNYVDSFETALIGPNFMDTAIGYRAYANINSCVDAFLIEEMTRNLDSYRCSFFLYKDKNSKGGKLVMAPIWDYDLTYGNADFCDAWKFTGWQYNFNYICGGDGWLNPFWFERMTQDSLFVQQTRCRWDELRGTIFSETYLDHWIDSSASVLQESQQWNFTTWPIIGTYVWPNYYIADSWQGEVDTLKWWIHQRLTWIDNNLGGSSSNCSQAGIGELSGISDPTVFPNPAAVFTDVSVFLQQPSTVSITLFNAHGVQTGSTKKYPGSVGNNIFHLDLNELTPGLYLVYIDDGVHLWSKKLICPEQ